MPELPEVETVCRALRPLLTGNAFQHVEQRRSNLRIPFPVHFEASLQGRKIERIERRAKYIQIFLDSQQALIIHLGMSGKLLIQDEPRFYQEPLHVHDHVIFTLSSGERVRYRDPRRFGLMTLCAADQLNMHPLFRHLGPEPLMPAFNARVLEEALKYKKTPIKTILLDQRSVVGIGNIYACEGLFRAGLSPLREAGTLSLAEIARLLPSLKQVLKEAIVAGGSTLRDHAQPNGELGCFQHSFKVYGREGQACLKCGPGHPIQRIAQAGRSTFYCVNCQV